MLLSLASQWPDSVRSVAVFGFTSHFRAGSNPLVDLATRAIGARWYVRSLGVLGHGLLINAVLNAGPMTDSPFAVDELRAARAAIQRSNGQEGYRLTLTACHSFFLPRDATGLGRIAVPTLIMHTAGDGSIHGLEAKVADTAAVRNGVMRFYGDDRCAACCSVAGATATVCRPCFSRL